MSEQDSLQLDGLRSSSSVMVGRRAGQHLNKRGAESSGEQDLVVVSQYTGGRGSLVPEHTWKPADRMVVGE
ncbi:ion channel [Aspergillus luchuensis]|uniref:Ion channel n=1 Tax=Aspergillus kawachii TaxID=1069201 RepID=A0A146F7Z9_ASPKA|nr:ion channel [Aspergillus luchuensis]